MGEIIRKSRASDIEALKELWLECFPEDVGYADFFFENIFRKDCAIVLESDGEIQGMIHSFPREIKTPLGTLSAKYIYGVGTGKKFRGKGVAGKLLDSEAEGADLLVLIPANESLFEFYKKQGFSEICEVKKLSLHLCGDAHFCKAEREDIPYMNEIYENSLKNSLYATRDVETWKLLLAEYEFFGGGFSVFPGGYCAHYEKDGELIISEAFGDGISSLSLGKEVSVTTSGKGTPIAVIRPISDLARSVLEKTEDRYINLMHN